MTMVIVMADMVSLGMAKKTRHLMMEKDLATSLTTITTRAKAMEKVQVAHKRMAMKTIMMTMVTIKMMRMNIMMMIKKTLMMTTMVGIRKMT